MSQSTSILYTIKDDDFARFQELILSRTGLVFSDNRREMLRRALTRTAKHAGSSSMEHYFADLYNSPTSSQLWDDLIKALTICETYFFRDTEQIEALRQHILPYIIARHWFDHTLRFWSAGCSTGEEPFTLAMLLLHLLPDISRWKILILATDINKQALHKAVQARYREWSFRQTDRVLRQTYFVPREENFELIPEVKQMVTFAYLNMIEDQYPSSINHTNNIDLILCRNISIYWPHKLIPQVAANLYRCLVSSGWLVVGPSETNNQFYHQFQTFNFNGAIVYQKINGVEPSLPLQSLFGGSKITTGTHSVPTQPRQSDIPFQELTKLTSQVSGRKSQSVKQTQLPEAKQAEILSLASSHPELQQKNSAIKPQIAESQVSREDTLVLCQKGQDYLIKRQYEEARQCFSTVLNTDPNHVTALTQMAQLEANSGHLNEAKMWAERALGHEPLRSEAHYILALIHQEQGEFDQAIARLKKVLYIDHDHILAHFSIANLYNKIGQTDEAKRHQAHAFHLASKLAPDDILPDSDNLTAKEILMMVQT